MSAHPSTQLIHVARQGTVIGKFQPAELKVQLRSGVILRSDHYWIVGMQGWQVIGDTFEDVSVGSVGRPPALPVSSPTLPAGTPPSLPQPQAVGLGGIPKAFYLTPIFVVGAFVALIVLLQGYAYVTLKAPLAEAMRSDSRNRGIDASAYYRYNIPGGAIVLNIDEVGADTKTVDMMRVLLQFAQTQKYSNYDWVILSCRGHEKFKMKGAHFKTLGIEYGEQNPMYTMRTLPENLCRMDGSRAYPVWEGGALGVMAEQMKNFSEFTTEWLR
jgi:hypothetical protein